VLRLIVDAFSLFTSNRDKLLSLAARHSIPTLYQFREFAADGGLVSYGADIADTVRQGAVYAGRILKGNKPAELPFVQAAKFELVVNLKTAKALGITVPPALLARADEVIE
jgi:putative ABC transport system substrate-binding protein